ncbi:MAG: hydantoinase/oxoprolinase family protein, partial [Pseudomonadota bacterium]
GVGEQVGDFPIYVPTVSVTSIGEGGGSIAWVDPFGVLKVGPESAGANPGPACYARGGTRPTVTDAFAVLGLLGGADLGYGAVSIDRAAATSALAPLAEALGLSPRDAAEAVLKVSVSGMFLGVSKLLSRYGADPRAFALLAFGGAGPMLACLLAREIGVRRIIAPPTPGVLSAYGGLICDIRNDFIRTVLRDLDANALGTLEPVVAEMEAAALYWLREEQGFDGTMSLIWTADMRYRGQSYEIETPIERTDIAAGRVAPIAEAFHASHHRAYDHSDPDAEVQIVNLRLVVAGTVPKPELQAGAEKLAEAVPRARAPIFLDGAEHMAALYHREDLWPGHHFSGPAIVAQDDCTTMVPPGFSVRVDGWRNLLITMEG